MICMCMLWLKMFHTEELKLVIEIFRHGARRELSEYKMTHPEFIEPGTHKGDLTAVGIRQHYILGKQLKNTYGDFIGKNGENLEFISSNARRALVSAVAQVYGLLEDRSEWKLDSTREFDYLPPVPHNFGNIDLGTDSIPKLAQLFPIDTIGHGVKQIFLTEFSKNCPDFNKKYRQIRKESEEMYYHKFSHIKDLFKKNGIHIPKKSQIGFLKTACSAYAVAVWADPTIKYDPELVQKCEIYVHFLAFTLARNPDYIKTSSTLLNKFLLSRLNDLISGSQNKNKFIAMSAHDTTLTVLLNNFFPKNYQCIFDNFKEKLDDGIESCIYKLYYSSNLIFNVYKVDSEDLYSVEMRLNNEVLNVNGKQRLSIKEFMQILESNLDPNYETNCVQKKRKEEISEKELLMYAFLLVNVLGVLVVLLILQTASKKKQLGDAELQMVDANTI